MTSQLRTWVFDPIPATPEEPAPGYVLDGGSVDDDVDEVVVDGELP